MNTVPNPPSFFYNDIEKWNAKFAKHIKEREYVKRHLAKTQEITCLTRNTNIKESDDAPIASKKGGKSGSVDPGKTSLFKEVLKRRKSRQSNFAPGSLDFDYAGDSSKF